MIHDHPQFPPDHRTPDDDREPAACAGRRGILGCALALTAAQFLGATDAAAATTGKFISAGAITAFKTGKPALVKLMGGRVPVFITKLSANSWQALYAVCTHESVALNLAPSHPNYAFICPNHDAEFTKAGRVLANQPAKRSLLKLPVKVVTGKVMVNVARFV